MAHHITDDLSIVIAGQAGQGIQSVAHLLTHILKLQGFHVFATAEYMSRVRGGINSTTIRISSEKRDAFRSTIDLFVSLDPRSFSFYKHRFNDKTMFLGFRDAEFCQDCVMEVNFISIAQSIGGTLYANTVAAGAILGLIGADEKHAREYLRNFFVKKGKDIITKNQEALSRGFKMGAHFAFSHDVHVAMKTKEAVKDDLFMSGIDAVGFGALAAGVDFCVAYPMSPSTGLLTFLAQNSKECGAVVEQATDEIEAVNMALGASYAGARSIVTTSGGGFDLMCEAVSLAGMIETPITFHIGQRPGPATGLPTHTGQEDLNLVLHAGHGEFMRAIFAPGTPMQAYAVTAHALDIADKYQIPTFVLTDQYFVDALYKVEKNDFVEQNNVKHIIETTRDYKRYALTENGVSERGVPGFGDGLVCVDGDEHDETGRITEDTRGIHMHMAEKRLFKRRALLEEVMLLPEVITQKTTTGRSKKSGKKLIVCWGSTRNTVVEAVSEAGNQDMTVVHFVQLFPLDKKKIKKIFAKAEKVIVVENNATGQFAHLLTQECDIAIDKTILKWNGEPFNVEELVEQIKKM
ncbi:MAG: 2-oxoacid:acceptor oxidoreductase subunit alpha [Parcubacteria group bacterium]|jgi:2-oxoglutarate ferredoxin oxidoreductase subunit alpha